MREEGSAASAEAKLQLRELLFDLARSHGPFVLAGSLPPGFSPGEFAEIVGGLASRGAAVIVDTSGAALRSAVAAAPDLVSPNEAELAELTGAPVASARAVAGAARMLPTGVHAVAVKRGRRGGVLVTREAAWTASVEADQTRVRNTVGAGDAFLAGLLVAREAKKPPPDQLASAVAAGTSAVLAGIVGKIDPDLFNRLTTLAKVHSL